MIGICIKIPGVTLELASFDIFIGGSVFNRRSLWGYKGDDYVPFIRITCADQRSLPKIRDEYTPSVP